MTSLYELWIVSRGTKVPVVRWPPGRREGSAERDLITDLCDRVRAKGVGVLRTEAHVIADVEAAFKELLFDAKAGVPHG